MTSSLRHTLIAACLDAVTATRLDRLLAPLTRGAGAILMFHHVRPARAEAFQPNALLEITPAFLDRTLTQVKALGFDVVPLDAVPDRLSAPRPRPFVALTFDDGYRDNLTHAAPILARHGCPWTMFVATDYAAGHGRLWWVELEEAVRRLDRIRVAAGGRTLDLRTGTAAEKTAAFQIVYWALRAGPEPALRDAIAGLCREAGIDSDALVRSLCLGWTEIRALARQPDVTIGAHTLSHPMLARHDAAAARDEILTSRARIEAEIGRPVRHFAYPVGDPTSAGPREFEIVREAGFETAVTTRPGHVFAQHAGHLAALPRVSVNGLHQNERAIRALLSGVPFWLRSRGRRLDVG